jgi:hypothetical protein
MNLNHMKTNYPVTDALIDSAVGDGAALIYAHISHANLERINANLAALLKEFLVCGVNAGSNEALLVKVRAALGVK